MITWGCYNMLWSPRGLLERQDASLDEVDQQALAMR